MLKHEYTRLKAFMAASQLSRLHAARPASSKRAVKGRAKYVNVPLKTSRVRSEPVERLYVSAHNYRALNPDSNLRTQAS